MAQKTGDRLLQGFVDAMPATLQLLEELVRTESPSNDRAATTRIGAMLAEQFVKLGARVQRHAGGEFGDHLQADFAGNAPGKPILLLGHFDTVWEIGTLRTMPYRLEKDRAFGPGIFDMKAGIALMLAALGELKRASGNLPRPVRVWLVSDEEVGSPSSRKFTERLARECSAVLVAEPAQGLAVKTARKGVGDFTLTVTGIASHAGLDFEKGHSAIVELARQIQKLTTFVDPKRGITVNPGVIRGGTRTNVVAAEAAVEVDLRITRAKDGARMEKKFRALKPFDRKCKLQVSGGVNRPPLEKTPANARLFAAAKEEARKLGFPLKDVAVGGGSDGNFTSALGIPTLDGLGAVGEGAHAANESVVLSELPKRAALLAALIRRGV